MRRPSPQQLLVGSATAALVGILSLWSAAEASDFHFVVQEVGEKRALWVPQKMRIHRRTEMQDGLVFVLENPTDRTHAFAAHGLFEEVMASHGDIVVRPLRVNVTSGDTIRVQVSTAQFQGIRGVHRGEEAFPFFCPLHTGEKGDAHQGGTIYVVP